MDTLTASQKWAPYALKAGNELGIDPAFILSQWMYETAQNGIPGTNLGARKYNNLAGIKSAPDASKGIFDPSDSQHAGYTSLSAFTQDYIRVMRLPYYKNVLSTAKPGASPLSELKAINASPWARDDYASSSFMKYYKEAAGVLGTGNYKAIDFENLIGGDLLGNVNTDGILTFLKEKWWLVAGALVIIAIVNR